MLGFGAHQRYYIYRDAIDMLKGYYGLSGMIRNETGRDPMNGDVYVFFNKTRHTVRMLVWDRDGYVVYSKRLERGCYEQIQRIMEDKTYPISYHHLVMLLSGVSLIGLHQRPRYELKTTG